MSQQQKRKHTTLTLVEKLEILNKLENGDKLRKTLKTGEFPEVEDALYLWFLQERNRHTPISGEILKEKAKYFYKRIAHKDQKDDFQASDGWLDKFKNRFGLRLLCMAGEKLSCDVNSVEPYKEKFQKVIQELSLTPDQVYNADESGLFWRLLPKKTFVHREESNAPGRKIAKDRITFMPCSNASGTHKLNLLVIGKAKNPRAFKNVKIPVDYKNQSKAWMTKSVFAEWFHETFVPAVEKFNKKQNLSKNALLIVDNCPGHPIDDLNHRFIRVMFLPPNVTPILQPMDQNVIQTVKMHYKKSLLYKVLSTDDCVMKSLKEINLKDVVFSLANAWSNVSKKVIVCSWKNLWPNMCLFEQYKKKTALNLKDDEENFSTELNELQVSIAEKLMDNEEQNQLKTDDIRRWIDGEEEENNQFLTDDDIVEEVMAEEKDNDGNYDDKEGELAVQTITHSTAIDSFTTSITWAEENGVDARDILVLKRLQEEVLKASFQTKKQKKIDDFLKPVQSKY
ncbi:jerky protein homolog-like [Daktulosphaira vitifoliae]|uniref:jerky protein homolog-like n=1 Tax=Daktulosphaira vitifoliae TaxID=58002 RepID=UPI0021A9ED3A|nr:jerky protein homolog-like [Daktulosphaira vitifoliae]